MGLVKVFSVEIKNQNKKEKSESNDDLKKSGYHALEGMRLGPSRAAHPNGRITQVRHSCHQIWLNSTLIQIRSNSIIAQILEWQELYKIPNWRDRKLGVWYLCWLKFAAGSEHFTGSCSGSPLTALQFWASQVFNHSQHQHLKSNFSLTLQVQVSVEVKVNTLSNNRKEKASICSPKWLSTKLHSRTELSLSVISVKGIRNSEFVFNEKAVDMLNWLWK